MCVSYPEAADENRFMWCCGVVQLVRQRDDKELRLDVRWDKEFIAEGESEKNRGGIEKIIMKPRDSKERSVEARCAGILKIRQGRINVKRCPNSSFTSLL